MFLRTLPAGTTTAVSLDTGAAVANGSSDDPAVDDDASVFAFKSDATDLVASDPNGGTPDVFTSTGGGANTLVSVSTDGDGANGDSSGPALSSDGSVVAFDSNASDLVASDTNALSDVFVRTGGTTSRASVSTTGTEGNGASFFADISATGRYVVFSSTSDNLVPGDSTGGRGVYVRDRTSNTTERIDLTYDGSPAEGNTSSPSISDDGRYVSFVSNGDRLVPVSYTHLTLPTTPYV